MWTAGYARERLLCRRAILLLKEVPLPKKDSSAEERFFCRIIVLLQKKDFSIEEGFFCRGKTPLSTQGSSTGERSPPTDDPSAGDISRM